MKVEEGQQVKLKSKAEILEILKQKNWGVDADRQTAATELGGATATACEINEAGNVHIVGQYGRKLLIPVECFVDETPKEKTDETAPTVEETTGKKVQDPEDKKTMAKLIKKAKAEEAAKDSLQKRPAKKAAKKAPKAPKKRPLSQAKSKPKKKK